MIHQVIGILLEKQRSFSKRPEQVYTEQQKHLSEHILPAKQVLMSSSRKGAEGTFYCQDPRYVFLLSFQEC